MCPLPRLTPGLPFGSGNGEDGLSGIDTLLQDIAHGGKTRQVRLDAPLSRRSASRSRGHGGSRRRRYRQNQWQQISANDSPS
jgi:hypothetical protein